MFGGCSLSRIPCQHQRLPIRSRKEKITIILFSGDLDKANADFIIANGAAAYDHEVSFFFTIWG